MDAVQVQDALNATSASLDFLLAEVAQLRAERVRDQVDYREALDTMWTLLAGFLFVFMHTGFSMREAGCVRQRDPQIVLAKNLLGVALVFLCWWGWGYALAFGATASPQLLIGGAHFFMDGLDGAGLRAWFLQGALCSVVVGISGGAMAERTSVRGFLLYTVAMSSLIYPVVAYWSWSGEGLLSSSLSFLVSSSGGWGQRPLLDGAGSGVVHLTGGIGALVGAIAVGPRKDRFAEGVPEEGALSSSTPFCVSGTFFLWFGWLGLHAGSLPGGLHDEASAQRAGLVVCNSILAPCVGGLFVALVRGVHFQRCPRPMCSAGPLDAGGLCNGLLAGLASIAAGAGVLAPFEAALVGLLGGGVYIGASFLVKRVRIDDAVDAIAVHGACGLWGLLAVGLFGAPEANRGGNGLLYGGSQLWSQVFAALLIVVWVGCLSALVFVPLRLLGLLREDGLDIERGNSVPSLQKFTSDELDQVVSIEL